VQAAEAALVAERAARIDHVSEEQVRGAYEAGTTDEQRRLLRLVLFGASVTAAADRKQPVEDRVEIHYKTLVFAG
jgi:hypothetical protein